MYGGKMGQKGSNNFKCPPNCKRKDTYTILVGFVVLENVWHSLQFGGQMEKNNFFNGNKIYNIFPPKIMPILAYLVKKL